MKIPSGMLSLLNKLPAKAPAVPPETKETPNVDDSNPSRAPDVASKAADAAEEESSGDSGAETAPGSDNPTHDDDGQPLATEDSASKTLVASGGNIPAEAPVQNDSKDGAAKFRNALNQLDSLLTKDFDAVSLALSRGIVKRVMIELREFPEYNGIIQDSDVRNIFIFLRRAVAQAKESGVEVTDKKIKKAKKASAIQINIPGGLDALGGLDTNSIESILGFKK